MNSAAILQQLTEAEERRQRATAEVDALRSQLDTAKRLDAASKEERAIYGRMTAGDYIVTGTAGLLWWCHNGNLGERVTTDEAAALYRLESLGIVGRHTKRFNI